MGTSSDTWPSNSNAALYLQENRRNFLQVRDSGQRGVDTVLPRVQFTRTLVDPPVVGTQTPDPAPRAWRSSSSRCGRKRGRSGSIF